MRKLDVGGRLDVVQNLTGDLMAGQVFVQQEDQHVTARVAGLHQRHLQLVVTPVRLQQRARHHHQRPPTSLNAVHHVGGDVLTFEGNKSS